MRKHTAPKTNIVFNIAMVLLVLVMASSYMTSGIYARYCSSASGSDSARVARFDVQETGTLYNETFTITMSPDSGVQTPTSLIITNKSEVAVRCIFSVSTTGNLPLNIYWSDGTNAVSTYDFAPNDTTGKTFDLHVEWENPDDDNYFYHREIDSITVTITCVQID